MPLVVVALAVPVFVVASLLVAAMLMTPAIVRLVASRRFPRLEARRGGSFWSSLGVSLGCSAIAFVAILLSIPFWFVPPLVLVLPPLIWGWLTYRVFAYDALALHASRAERRRLLDRERWPLLAMGIVCGAIGAAPSLLWAVSAMTVVLAPLLIVVSIWLYTLVFAFSSLWFAHYLLEALQRLRRDESIELAPPGDRSELPAPPSRDGLEALQHEHRSSHRRRRDPLGQARRQAHAQGDRAARRARPVALVGPLRGRRSGAHHRRSPGRVRERRPRLLVRRHRRDAGRPHPAMRCGGARRAAAAASAGARPRHRAHAGHRPRAGQDFRPRSRGQPASTQHGGVPGRRRDHSQPLQQDRRIRSSLRRGRRLLRARFPGDGLADDRVGAGHPLPPPARGALCAASGR